MRLIIIILVSLTFVDLVRSFTTLYQTRKERNLLYDKNVKKEFETLNEYSRCLKTPREQIQEEEKDSFELINKRPWYKNLFVKPIKYLKKKLYKKKKPGYLILLRTGQSLYNQNYTFTGWQDPDLTLLGMEECEHAAQLLLEAGIEPDIVYTSKLKRAIHTVWEVKKELGSTFLPVIKSWRLNERHYGKLEGLCKKETAKQFGSDVVQAWRRSLYAKPPPLDIDDAQHPRFSKKYADIPRELLPNSESLKDCMDRTEPLWEYKIKQDLAAGNNVLVVAHANTLRGLIKIIDDVNDKNIVAVSMPKGIPLLYKFDKCMKPLRSQSAELTQIHTTGTFLEKPGLLEEALKSQREWEMNVPGTSEHLKRQSRISTVEESLLKLKQAQKKFHLSHSDIKMESDLNGHPTSSPITNIIEEEFEEDVSTLPKQKIKPNVNEVNNLLQGNDPFVVLVRHGRTPHNQLSLFTGWEDPPLTQEGIQDAKNAGILLKRHGFEFDVVYTSWLYRAIDTAWNIMDQLDMAYLPLIKSWRLNERHYGSLTGKSKKMIANEFGEEQLKKWRRGYNIRPPPASSYSKHYPGNDVRRIKYVKDLRISIIESICRSIENRKLTIHRKFPKSESLKDCMARTIPFYTNKIYKEAVLKGKRVLITSHENAIRGILMHLCEIPEEHMNELHIPNGLPLIYNVKRKCISLLDDGSGLDPMTTHHFGSAAQFLFRPCELTDDDFIPQPQFQEQENKVYIDT